MYKIEAIVRPERLPRIAAALEKLGCGELIVGDVHGHGSQPGPVASYRGVKYEIPFVHQLRVECAVLDTTLDAALEQLVAAAFTGESGDGKIFVTKLCEVIEIGECRAGTYSHTPSVTRPRLAATADATFPRSS